MTSSQQGDEDHQSSIYTSTTRVQTQIAQAQSFVLSNSILVLSSTGLFLAALLGATGSLPFFLLAAEASLVDELGSKRAYLLTVA